MATGLTNKQIVDAIVQKYPHAIGENAKLPYQLITSEGFDEILNFKPEYIGDFFTLSIRVWLQIVNISHAKDILEDNGFGEYFDQPWGGITQRMAINSVKPIDPAWKNLKNGDSPDPFVVRKPEAVERFYNVNFDYASLITVPDSYQYKQIFVSNFGIDEFMAGIMEGLRNGYTLAKYTTKIDALNAMINVEGLKATQQVSVPMADTPTAEQYTDFIIAVNNVVSGMTVAPQTGAFNVKGYKSTQDKSRLKLLLRMGIRNDIKAKLLASAFNRSDLNMDVDVIEVPNFGGLVPYSDATFTTQLYPVYGKLGDQIGWATTQNAETPTITDDDEVFWKDPNATVLAILADKGVLFETRQNPYSVEPIRNPRGLYTNYWASSPNNGIHFDKLYNYVVFIKGTVEG